MNNILWDGEGAGKGVMIGERAGKSILGYRREIDREEHLGLVLNYPSLYCKHCGTVEVKLGCMWHTPHFLQW